MEKCYYGCGNDAKFFFKNGKGCCSPSVNKCPYKRIIDSQIKKGTFTGIPYWKIPNFTKNAWNKGLKTSEDVKEKIKKSLTGKSTGRGSTPEIESKRKEKISSSMKLNDNCGGIRKGSGIGKSGWYKGIWCDSTWELCWVIYNLDNGIDFERNLKGFNYFYEGKERKYYPDFKINDIYFEIKGRRCYDDLDEKTKTKFKYFTEKLIILYEKDIKFYIDYVIKTYGENYFSLYEFKN